MACFDYTNSSKVGDRAKSLNYIAGLRSSFLKIDSNKEILDFFDVLNDRNDIFYSENKRALSAIFFMAGINKQRHHLNFNKLTDDEKSKLIKAMNHFRAVVSLFPKHLALPE